MSSGSPIRVLPTPPRVVVPLRQHIGAPPEPVAGPKTLVSFGQKLGECRAFVSAPVHSPLSGTVERHTTLTLPTGIRTVAVPVSASGDNLSGRALLDEILGGDWDYERIKDVDPDEIAARVQDAGIVGLGGATFPTHVKLISAREKGVELLIVNGCECEPYLTADHRMMLEAARAVLCGALLAARACGGAGIAVAVEDNKLDAVRALEREAAGTGIRVVTVKTKYPMGGERELVPAVTGRLIPSGGLPLDVGVVVINVGTAAAIARAVLRGGALTHRVVTVTGAVHQPGNLLAPIGAACRDLLDFCGGIKPDAARIVAGGPMMGFALADLDTPLTKGTSGLVVLRREDVEREAETECIRCARCVDVCPTGLVPTKIALAARNELWDRAEKLHASDCIECGCCAYVCPARIPLVQLIKVAKARLAEIRRTAAERP
ncbi:MAG TPA: electron transport complex subunit RsxC [Kiritimatiellae bacterium]|nr:electron transport complex subunit RsxC [Kiritimatiellia bacterium]